MDEHIKNFINNASEQECAVLSLMIYERKRYLISKRGLEVLSELRIGSKVTFNGNQGQVFTGNITKINRKTANVHTTIGQNWNVALSLLKVIE